MRNNVFVLPVCVAFTAFVSLLACSSAVPDQSLGGDDQDITQGTSKKDAGTKKTDAGTGGQQTGNNPPSGTPSGGGDASTGTGSQGTGACAGNGNQETCYTCCEEKNPKALPILFQAFGDCACVTPGACKAACAQSFCAGKDPQPGDACDKCLTGQDMACGQQADKACEGNADCAPLFKCDDDSKCEQRAQ